jgi:hypothetical protein
MTFLYTWPPRFHLVRFFTSSETAPKPPDFFPLGSVGFFKIARWMSAIQVAIDTAEGEAAAMLHSGILSSTCSVDQRPEPLPLGPHPLAFRG